MNLTTDATRLQGIAVEAPDRPPRIVVDGSHLLMPGGTGIASYGRTLAANLQALGASVAVLFGAQLSGQATSGSGLLSEVFGGGRRSEPSGRAAKARELVRTFLRSHERPPVEVPIGLGNLASIEPALPPIDRAMNISGLFRRADRRFSLRRRMTGVRLPEDTALAHWTFPVPLRALRTRNVFTVHDAIPLRYPHLVVDRAGRAAALYEAVARDADLIVTVSEASKQDIVELLRVPEERIVVTYQSAPAADDLSDEDARRIARDLYGLEAGKYIFFAGAIEPKKNVRRLVEAHAIAGADMPLVLAGPLGWMHDVDIETIAKAAAVHRLTRGEAGLGFDYVRHVGLLPRSHLAALMRSAGMFCFPSLCEGFGLPVLEAMQAGVPVVTSKVSSLPEVAGDAALLADPLKPSEIAAAIRRLARDSDLRDELAARGRKQAARFSPERYQARLAAAYAKVGVQLKPRDS